MISIKQLQYATLFAIILALSVVMLGAFTRLTDAGLGCPDWPGCYGHMVLPSAQSDLARAQSQYPEIPVEPRKAWTEMAHRYAAGTLGVLIFFISTGMLAPQFRKKYKLSIFLPIFLIALVLFQAALGMWTVTLKLLPIVVMGHLLGGITIFVSLIYLYWQLSLVLKQNLPHWRFWVNLGIVIVFFQIALGGWVSSNYAGIACIGFPQCNGQWLPHLDFSQAFNLSTIGKNYQGGLLNNEARVTIQFIHRLGGVITAIYCLMLSIFILIFQKRKCLRFTALFIMVFVLLQFTLGIVNVIYLLPLPAAVAHNGVAALLLASVVSLRYLVSGRAHHAS